MNRNSYLNPDDVKRSCDEFIKRLNNENSNYAKLNKDVCAFITDGSSAGEAVNELKQRIGYSSVALGSLVLANCYDIDDASTLSSNVGDEVLSGEVILDNMETALSDADHYRGEASSAYSKAYRATSQEEIGYWNGQGSHYDGLASQAMGTYDFYHKKEERYDEINDQTASLFQSSKEIRNKANSLLIAIISGQYDEEVCNGYKADLKNYIENRDIFLADATFDEVNDEIIWDPDAFKGFDRSTFEGDRIAQLVDERDAYIKAMESDPSQANYYKYRIDMINKTIENIVNKGLDNANHSEEFGFTYDYFDGLGYTEEEKLMIFTYWMSVDPEADLSGKEMPKWWEAEHLNVPSELVPNESNVNDLIDDPDMRGKYMDYYFSSYFIVDSISGRPWQDQVEDTMYFDDDKTYDAKTIREEYQNSLEDLRVNGTDVGFGEMVDIWYDAMYGDMMDYVNGVGSVRASKYALETHVGFADTSEKKGVDDVHTNIEDDFYKFCRNAYIYKYNHSDDFYNNIWTSDEVNERFFNYITDDLNAGIYYPLSHEERAIIAQSRAAYTNGDMMYCKNVEDLIEQLKEEHTLYSYGEYDVQVDGDKVIITAVIIDSMNYAGDKHVDQYVMDLSDCCIDLFGSQYISYEKISEKMLEYATYRYDNGWVDPWVMEEREQSVELIMDSVAQEYGFDLSELSEEQLEELKRQSFIYADQQDKLLNVYFNDRETAADKFNEEWDEMMLILGVSVAIMTVFTPGIVVEGAAFLLGVADGTKKILQGDTAEGSIEIGVSAVLLGCSVVKEAGLLDDFADAAKGADELIENSDDAYTWERFLGSDGAVHYSEFADGMSLEDAQRYITNNDKLFEAQFYERLRDAGLSADKIDDAYAAYKAGDLEKFTSFFDFSTPKDCAVFWSGDIAKATEFAESMNGVTAGMTPGGKVFADWKAMECMNPEWYVKGTINPLWKEISIHFANGAEGIVNIIYGDKMGPILKEFEIPILEERLEGDLITDIIYHRF